MPAFCCVSNGSDKPERKSNFWKIIEWQAAQLKKCDEIISRLEAENALLRQRVDLLVREVIQ